MAKKDYRKDPDVVQVWEAWRSRQKRPHCCLFTIDRAELIRKKLSLGYPVDAMLALIEYAYEADTNEARFWRGENDRRTVYLDLKNLTWDEKIGGRVQRALEWREDQKNREAGAAVLDDHREEREGRAGSLARFRRRGVRS